MRNQNLLTAGPRGDAAVCGGRHDPSRQAAVRALPPRLTLIMVRHAHSLWNLADERHAPPAHHPLDRYPDGDFPLSPEGHVQCAQHRNALSLLNVDSWLHSPLMRAAHTARALAPDAPWRAQAGWRERSWGTLETCISMDRPRLAVDQQPPGGESLLDLRTRVMHNLTDLSAGRHLVVCHAGLITMTAAVLQQVPLAALLRYWQHPPQRPGNLQALVWQNHSLRSVALQDLQRIEGR